MSRDLVDQLLAQWRHERPDQDVSGLGLVVRVELLAKCLQRETGRVLGELGLKTWEYDVLSALRRQGSPYELPATRLASDSLLSSGAMTTRIDQLEDKGWVRREPDPDDRRGVRVILTPRGKTLVNTAFKARLSAAEFSLEALERTERESVDGGLRKLMVWHENAAPG